ncbi:MAG: class I SAM-dependent methyltransferase [Flavobacteriales bacterium]
MSDDRWLEFWRDHGRGTRGADEQTQVLRTLNKEPITEQRWRFTLQTLDKVYPVGADDDVLDLCCGNGLFTAHFAPKCRSVTAVDISPDLLHTLQHRGLPNVTTQCVDMRTADFPEGAFSRILLYAGLQYIDHAECIALFRRMARWLRPGGLLFVGDIPDRSRLWAFYNTPERQALYFDNLIAGRDVIGTWFDGEWLQPLCASSGFARTEVLAQDPELICAHFRFDLLVTR